MVCFSNRLPHGRGSGTGCRYYGIHLRSAGNGKNAWVHRQTIYYIVANEDFELIKVGRYKRATKESFEKWYHNQTRYQLAEDRQERS